ncbi:glycosyltransferase [Steroidobacter sp. S1-65]|uniref:Glycosyltransferase n=1 Tax=Steroidobacter gossypii TaxID=2805490 RepID=A0ABS1X436_9GAMM|nr:glycosyltransferase [Steroidobacter gossypii]MBM0107988.1 glycosyltransferase [Steroidobacter gossypii]
MSTQPLSRESVTPSLPSISVIVPVCGRRSELRALYQQYKAGVAAIGLPFEFIFVIDGDRTDACRTLEAMLQEGEDLTVINLTRSFGEAAALMAGFERSAGSVILTLPAYHQIEAQDIPKLLAALSASDMAIGYRSPRYGNLLDRMRRSAYHGLVNFVTGSRLQDIGCGARAMRRQVFEEMDLYGDQHRFMAILATRLGFRVSEVAMRQSPQDRLARMYRPKEYAHHVLDLFSIFFLTRFTKRPLRFFGMLGAATFGIGAAVIALLSVQRLFFDEKLADRPALLLGALLVVLGMQVFALGLLGELIIFTHARGMKDYRVQEVIQYPETVTSSVEVTDVEPAEGRNNEIRHTAPPAMTA